jgi:hypothetical protein
VPDRHQCNSLPQGIQQRIFSLKAPNSANSAQNQKIWADTQGKAQGFQGICPLTASGSMTYDLL